MARVVYGPMITDARNKQGSVVFTRCRAGAMTRALITPPNPRSIYQVNVRDIYGTLINDWGTLLTEAQRAAWTQRARATRWRTKMGNYFTPTPLNLFVKRNAHSLQAGGTLILTPPADINPTDPGPLTLTAVAATPSLTLTPTNALPAGYGALTRCTKPLSPGIANFNKWLFLITPIAGVMILDTFTSGPVPPWTAAPNYNGTNWSESFSTLHAASSVATYNEFYRTVANSNLQIRVNMAVAVTLANNSILTFRINPATGQRLELRILNPPAKSQLVSYANWASAAALVNSWGPWTPADLAYHTYKITLLGQYVTLEYDSTTLLNCSFAGFSSGAVGFNCWGSGRTYQGYSATAITGANPNPGDITAAYTGKFSGWTTGQKIGVSLRYVHLATGIASPERSAYAIST